MVGTKGHTKNVHSPKRYLPLGTNKSYQHSTKRTGQIPRINLRQQTKLETTHNQEKKKKQMDQITKELNWLIGKKSYISNENKLLIYNTIIKPTWTYGIQLWDAPANPTLPLYSETSPKYSDPSRTHRGMYQTIPCTQI
jgi:hypothetical protein